MLKELTREAFFALFSVEVHPQLEAQLVRPGVEALVVFECQQMDSSSFGSRTALIVGAPFTYKSVEATEGRWLNDLPSQRQYPTSFYRVPKTGG